MPEEPKVTATDNAGDAGTASVSDSDKEKNFRALEDARNKSDERSKKLLDSTVSTLVKGAGLDPNKGFHKLLVENYKQSLGADGVPTEESLSAYLKDNDFEVAPPRSQQEIDLDAQRSVTDAIRSDSTQPVPTDSDDLIKEAESKGQWDTSMDLKLAKQLGLIQ